MGSKGNKFGTFKGVFTPSILTILGVIMYLRLPWIVGEAGLIATIGIILIAHLISVSTGLSVASIATDKHVEAGGPYFMISRSLGLPIGGTLGLALFVGLSFSVSLYLIGFSETFLSAMGFENTLSNIRLTGAITLAGVAIITLISTNLALKAQFIIFTVMGLSLISIFSGSHEFRPAEALIEPAGNALPWIALFAVFFPAVTGFTAGVSMSGDLRDPKKAIPRGTITAILVGLLVYLGLAIFFALTVSRNLLKDPTVLYQISLFSPLVIAGIWGATLSSAVGSILGAPRILQATAIDRVTPRFFAKGYGSANEPRNALILTFIIAFAGIMIGDLNAIARLVSIFFIITYGFLNLTCAIESIVGSDFRPSFRVPPWIGFFGAFACFIVMIQLDVIAMLAAIIILGALFLILKRRELTLQSGDTWGGIWSSLVKTGLFRLSERHRDDKRNWRPNIILFSGNPSVRPHLINMARTIVGKLGVFTNFELIVEKPENKLSNKATATITTHDEDGKKVFTRRHVCNDIYDGINTISNVYGFTGFEPNTVLLGWGRSTKDPEKFITLAEQLNKLDYNLVLLDYKKDKQFGRRQQIHLWWNNGSNNLLFGITLLKFIHSDPEWRRAKLKIFFVSPDSSISEKAQTIIRQVLDDQRMDGSIKIIENSIEKKPLDELFSLHSHDADLTILDYHYGGKKNEIITFNNFNKIVEAAGTSLIIRANSSFDAISLSGRTELKSNDKTIEATDKTPQLAEQIPYPNKEILANELHSIAVDLGELHDRNVRIAFGDLMLVAKSAVNDLQELNDWAITAAEKILKEKETSIRSKNLTKLHSDYLFQADRFVTNCEKELIPALSLHFKKATNTFIQDVSARLEKLPEKVSVKYDWSEFKPEINDSMLARVNKFRKRNLARLMNKQVTRKTPLRRIMVLFLIKRRKHANHELFQQTGITLFTLLSNLRRNLIESNDIIREKIRHAEDLVTANIELKEGKERLQEINRQMLKQLTDNAGIIIQQAVNELQAGLEKTSFMLGNPQSDRDIRIYEKALRKNEELLKPADNPHEILENNLQLYLNKTHTEFIIFILKARLRARLAKHAEDLGIMVENRIVGPLRRIKEITAGIGERQTDPQSNSLFDEIKNQQAFDLHFGFDRFFKENQTIINELPEKTELIHPDFIQDIEKGDFSERPGIAVELKKKINLLIGRDLANNLRIELDNSEENLNTALRNINDIIRLAVFNLENIANTNETGDSVSGSEARSGIVDELLERIDNEQRKAENIFKQTIANMNALLDRSFEPMSTDLLARPEKPIGVAATKNKTLQFFSNAWHGLRHNLLNQWVKLIYTRSEGLLFFKRLQQLEKDKRTSRQGIFEILETLVPNPAIVKAIPYYYANLFAGNSTINKDLWVGMQKQIHEANRIIQRFNGGYGGALLITGERNSGKSSLSRYIAREFSAVDKSHVIRAPKQGSSLVTDLHQAFRQAMNTTLDVNYLLEIQSDKQVFLLHDLELWWERTPEGSAALEELFGLVDRFGKKHLFIINCRNWPFEFMNQLYGLEKHFAGHILCEPFDARELKEMIMFRHKAGGLKFRLNNKDEGQFSEYDYARLFNRYFMLGGGNPGYTVRSWMSNITGISGKTLEIRRPILPETATLAELRQEVCLIVLQFILHRRFTIQKLAGVLRQPDNYAIELITSMQRTGLIEEKFPGVYALNMLLEPFLIEELKQRNLL